MAKLRYISKPQNTTKMAPDRGRTTEPAYQTISTFNNPVIDDELDDEGMQDRRSEELDFLSEHGHEPQNFTLRGILVGLGVGLIICFSNMYFGLQSMSSISVFCFPCLKLTEMQLGGLAA